MTALKLVVTLFFASSFGFVLTEKPNIKTHSEFGKFVLDVSTDELKVFFTDLHTELDDVKKVQIFRKDDHITYLSTGVKDGVIETASITYPKIAIESYLLPPPCSCNFQLMYLQKGNRIICTACSSDD